MANQFIKCPEANDTLHHSYRRLLPLTPAITFSDELATRARYREGEDVFGPRLLTTQAMVQGVIKLGYHEAIDSFSSNKILNLAAWRENFHHMVSAVNNSVECLVLLSINVNGSGGQKKLSKQRFGKDHHLVSFYFEVRA